MAIMFQVRDDPDLNQLQAGILYFDAKRKPAFRAFRFPFVLERISGQRLRVWSKLPNSGKLKVQRRGKGGWRRLTRSNVRAGQVYTTTLRTEQGGRYRAVLGGEKSLVWRQR